MLHASTHRRWIWAILGVVGVTVGLAIAAPGPAVTAQPAATTPFKRDWQANPAVAELRSDADIYVIGDMHGDYEKAVKLVAGSGLIGGVPASPKEATWTGGKNVLVCTGDMIDKWNEGMEVLDLMRTLQKDAEKSGGKVVVALGNHEAEFLASRGEKKKAAEFAAELTSKGIEPLDVVNGSDALGIGAWLRNRPIAVKVNDWFFCHAGNTFGMTVKELEQRVEAGVDKDGFGTYVLAEPNSILEAKMGLVPWWMLAATSQDATGKASAAALNDSPGGTAALKKYIAALGCNHLVVGHQPGKVSFGGGVERKAGEPFAYEGLLFLEDVGLSRGAQDGHGIVLKVHHGTKERVTTIDAAGHENILWVEP